MGRILKHLGAFGAACAIAGLPAVVFAAPPAFEPVATPDGEGNDKPPPGFKYTNLWTSKDGNTHISECEMKGFVLKSFAQKGAPQFVRQFGAQPEKISFTQLPPGTKSDLHSCPGVQFVVDMAGNWYVETTDGTRKVFQPGDVLFQDNVESSPAASQPRHYSGVEGDRPCNQMVIQVARAAEMDNPCPF